MEPTGGGLVDRGDEAGPLQLEPGQSLAERVEGGLAPPARGLVGEAPPARDEELLGRVRGVEVPLDHPPAGILPFPGGLLGLGSLSGVQSQQVVQTVTARGGGDVQQMGIHERLQIGLGRLRALLGEGSRHPAGEVGTGDEAEPAEHPSRVRAQGLVGECEAGPHTHVPGGELGQAAPLVGKALDQGGEAHRRPDGEPSPGDAHRQRQVAAEADHLRRGIRLGSHPFGTGAAPQQLEGLPWSQHIEREELRSFGSNHPGQKVTAGDEHHTARAGREQGTYLFRRGGVVQDQQGSAAHKQATEAGCLLLQIRRENLRASTERAQEPIEHLGGTEALGGFIPVQVHVELGIGKIGCQLMGQMDRKGGLAHARGAGDHQDHDRSGPSLGDHGTELAQFPGPSREMGNVGRELVRCLQPGLEHVGLPARSVRAVDLVSSRFVQGYEGPGRDAQLSLVGLDDVDGGQPVTPLVLDEGAVRTVQPPREASERDAAPLPSAAKSDAQTDLRARVGRL